MLWESQIPSVLKALAGLAEKVLPWRNWWAAILALFYKPAPGTHFTILVTKLDRDADGRHRDHVLQAIANVAGNDIHILRDPRVLRLNERLVSAEADAELVRTAQKWLGRRKADILIWGEVAEDNKTLRLGHIPRIGGANARKSAYHLERTELPAKFSQDWADILGAVVLSDASPAVERGGQYLVEMLKPVAQRLEALPAKPNPGAHGAEFLAKAHFSLGLVSHVLGTQAGDNEYLSKAITAFEAALREYTRERVPLQWARTKNNLGNVLWELGRRETDAGRLEQAVSAYEDALQEYTRKRVPLDWAGTKNNLGTALMELGRRETGTARLEQAVSAYEDSLQELTRERVPLQWAMTKNNLGNALLELGERENDTSRLKQAVSAYEEALQERTRQRVPLDWAMTKNNLGAALMELGRRETGTARLEQAVSAYSEALQERSRQRVPLDWAMTKNNLGNVLSELGRRENDTARLEQSVEALSLSLEEFRKSGASRYIAITEGNLEQARALLAERRLGVSGSTPA